MLFIIVLLCCFLVSLFVLGLCVFFLGATLYTEVLGITKPSAPFVPLPHDAVRQLVSRMDIFADAVIYDLGCGDGRILSALYAKNADARVSARYVGIEHNAWAWVVAQIMTRKIPKQNFYIQRGDVFKEDLSNATHVTTYLFPKLLDALLPKLKRELRPGTTLYSIDFSFSQKEPTEIVQFDRPAKALGQKLFVYQF